ncbi:MAG: hypothetical protein HN380_24435 [Victivallales bacterium]|jgi:hypothetical protein|nr:hypothetical protein [Victivallales bacterium]
MTKKPGNLESWLREFRPVAPSPGLRDRLGSELAEGSVRLGGRRPRLWAAAAALVLVLGALAAQYVRNRIAPQVISQTPSPLPPPVAAGVPSAPAQIRRLTLIRPLGEPEATVGGKGVRPAAATLVEEVSWQDPDDGRRSLCYRRVQHRLVALPLVFQ